MPSGQLRDGRPRDSKKPIQAFSRGRASHHDGTSARRISGWKPEIFF
jgi:hypothetical protein